MNIRNYTKSFIFFEKVILDEKEINKNYLIFSRYFHAKGVWYEHNGYYIKALRSYKKALSINKRFLDESFIENADIYNSIGVLYMSRNKYKKALNFFNKSLAIEKKSLSIAKIYNNKGMLYFHMKDKKKALQYLKKSLLECEGILEKNSKILIPVYTNIAVIYKEKDNNEKSLKYINKAFNIFLKIRTHSFNVSNNLEKEKYLNLDSSLLTFLFETTAKYFSQLKKENKRLKEVTIKKILYFWLKYKGTIAEYKNILFMIENSSVTDSQTKELIKKIKRITIKLANLKENNTYYIKKQLSNMEIKLSNQNQKFREQLKLEKGATLKTLKRNLSFLG